MRIAIVDDEKKWLEKAKDIILRWKCLDATEVQVIDEYCSGDEYIKSGIKYDLTFVDVEMKDMNGFETITKAKEYNNEGIFVILTTHNSLSSRGYLVNAFRYIDKMKMNWEMVEALNSAFAIYKNNIKISVNIVGEGVHQIFTKDILYIETESRNVVIHKEATDIRCSNTIKEIEEQLINTSFYKCHKAIIVNLSMIKKVDNCNITLKNGVVIYAAKRKEREVKQLYLDRKYEFANA